MIELPTVYLWWQALVSRLYLLWMVCLLATGCGKDTTLTEPAASPSDLSISLRLGFPNPLTVATRSNPIKNGIELKDVRVLQFPVATSIGIKNNLYSEATTGTSGTVVTNPSGWYGQESDGSLITVNTGVDDFTNTNCHFYIVANAKSALSVITTEDGLKTASLDFTDIAIEPGVLTYGPVDYTQVAGTTKPVALLAKLRRAYAKVTVQYTPGTGINITSVDVENVPDKIFPFPESSGISSSSASYLATPSITPTASNEVTFYMPENLKGNGTATTEADKNLTAKGPTGTLDGCTCIVLKGTYDYYPDNTASEPIGVEYRFYLGADMVRNYDVERGKYYTLTVNLKGANSADARVNITDGNVFTFDEPDDVDNNVKFE